jgi:hypothetical protein
MLINSKLFKVIAKQVLQLLASKCNNYVSNRCFFFTFQFNFNLYCNIQINTPQHTSGKIDEALRQKLATYVYNHCNIYNITIYF